MIVPGFFQVGQIRVIGLDGFLPALPDITVFNLGTAWDIILSLFLSKKTFP